VKEYSTFLSTALARKHGVRAGTNVSIFCSNSIWYPITLFAAIRLGAVVTGSSPEYNADEMAYIMKASSTALIFADRDSIETVIAAAASLGISKDNIVLLGEAVDNHSTLLDLLRFGRTFGPENQVSRWDLPVGQSNKEACAYLSFTSGTTSLPKAVSIFRKSKK
jgi:4-coumarate--CoA ligase